MHQAQHSKGFLSMQVLIPRKVFEKKVRSFLFVGWWLDLGMIRKILFIFFLEFIHPQSRLDAFKKMETETHNNIVEKVVKIKNGYHMIKPENAVAGNIGVYEDKKGLIILIVAPTDPTNIIKSNLFQFSLRICLGFNISIGSFMFLSFWYELPT